MIFSALVAVASAVVLPGPAYPAYPAYHGVAALPAVAKIAAPVLPVAKYAVPAVAKVAVPEPYDPNPQYSFSYDVHVSRA